MNIPKVSIVIPVYNGSNYLREAIDSAVAQTYRNIEIIVVNDGSNDNGETETIALSYGDKIRYFSKENGGTSTALNMGIINMTGEYFSWLSHDDKYYPDKIKRQIEELDKLEDKATIMMTDLDGINERYEKIYQTNYVNHIKQYPLREKSFIHPIIYNQTHGCTLLIPTVCFEEIGLFDESQRVAQDFEFFYRIFKKYPHKLISEVLVTARDSNGRQGLRSKVQGNIEYSLLFIKIIEGLSEDEYLLLAESKMDFYTDRYSFFESAGYTIALEYIRKKIEVLEPTYFINRELANVQVPMDNNQVSEDINQVSNDNNQQTGRSIYYLSLFKRSLKYDGLYVTLKRILKKMVKKLRRK